MASLYALQNKHQWHDNPSSSISFPVHSANIINGITLCTKTLQSLTTYYQKWVRLSSERFIHFSCKLQVDRASESWLAFKPRFRAKQNEITSHKEDEQDERHQQDDQQEGRGDRTETATIPLQYASAYGMETITSFDKEYRFSIWRFRIWSELDVDLKHIGCVIGVDCSTYKEIKRNKERCLSDADTLRRDLFYAVAIEQATIKSYTKYVSKTVGALPVYKKAKRVIYVDMMLDTHAASISYKINDVDYPHVFKNITLKVGKKHKVYRMVVCLNQLTQLQLFHFHQR